LVRTESIKFTSAISSSISQQRGVLLSCQLSGVSNAQHDPPSVFLELTCFTDSAPCQAYKSNHC